MIAVQITSGQGPAECKWVVARIEKVMRSEAEFLGIRVHDVVSTPGEKADCLRSCALILEGDGAEDFIATWRGTIRWIGDSPFRNGHRRRNWFVGIATFTLPEHVEWSPHEVRIEAMQSSGPGGQHVNTTASAVRATHLPTGVSVVARDERSQHRNRALALARLAATLAARADAREADLRHGRCTPSSNGATPRGCSAAPSSRNAAAIRPSGDCGSAVGDTDAIVHVLPPHVQRHSVQEEIPVGRIGRAAARRAGCLTSLPCPA